MKEGGGTAERDCFIFENVFFKWSQGQTILDAASFAISKGDLVILKGPSGSGKTTLLRLMNLLEIQQGGSIFYDGHDLRSYDPVVLRQCVGFLPQVPQMSDMSIRDALLQPFCFSANKHLVVPSDEELNVLLSDLYHHPLSLKEYASTLSVGQKQRLSFIRMLLLSPDVLLLDEPTASLDSESRRKMIQNIHRQHIDGKTIIVVTHDPRLFESISTVELTLEKRKVVVA